MIRLFGILLFLLYDVSVFAQTIIPRRQGPVMAVLPFVGEDLKAESAETTEFLQLVTSSVFSEVAAVEPPEDVNVSLLNCNLSNVHILLKNGGSEIGHHLGADFVVIGTYTLAPDKMTIRVKIFQTSSGTEVNQVSATNVDPQRTLREIFFELAQALPFEVPKVNRDLMLERGAGSFEAMHEIAKAKVLNRNVGGGPTISSLLEKAVSLEPKLAEAHAELGMELLKQGQLEQAEQCCQRALQLKPNLASAHSYLASVLDSKGQEPDAEIQFRKAVELSDCIPTRMRLGFFLCQHGRYPEGTQQLKDALEKGPRSCFASMINDTLLGVQAVLHLVPPADFTPAELAKTVIERTGRENTNYAVSPLEYTPQMASTARALVQGSGDNETRARKLYNALRAHFLTQSKSSLTPGAVRRAEEAFSDLGTGTRQLFCNDYAVIYVALARSVGLKAYAVYVEPVAENPHACAAILLDRKTFIVDPTQSFFASFFPKLTILNDLQALAVYLSQLPSLETSKVAAKLAPDIPLVQLNLFEKLTSEARLAECRVVVSKLRILYAGTPTEDYVNGRLALLEGRPAVAENFLMRAVDRNTNCGVFFIQLAFAKAQQNQLAPAADYCKKASQCTLTGSESEEVRRLLSNRKAIAAWGSYGRGLAAAAKGNIGTARSQFEEALEILPEYGQARVALRTLNSENESAKPD